MTLEEAEAAVHDMLAGNAFGDASPHRYRRVPDGEEASFIVMVDGEQRPPMATPDLQTRGQWRYRPEIPAVWGYSPAPVAPMKFTSAPWNVRIIAATAKGMARKETSYTGFLWRRSDDKTGQL